jgi:ApaG protein
MPQKPTLPSKYKLTCTVVAQYLAQQSSPEDSIYGFAYTVTITNAGQVTAQLISRHWEIVDANGHVEEVKGLGVVGHQPLLKPGESFQYSSGSRLRTPTGAMHGTYFCVAEDGERFEALIPMFVLQAEGEGGKSGGAPTTRTLH